MRTTLVIPDPIFKQARDLAHQRHQPLSELVTEGIRRIVADRDVQTGVARRKPVRLASFQMGKTTVDVSNREELFRVLDEK